MTKHISANGIHYTLEPYKEGIMVYEIDHGVRKQIIFVETMDKAISFCNLREVLNFPIKRLI